MSDLVPNPRSGFLGTRLWRAVIIVSEILVYTADIEVREMALCRLHFDSRNSRSSNRFLLIKAPGYIKLMEKTVA